MRRVPRAALGAAPDVRCCTPYAPRLQAPKPWDRLITAHSMPNMAFSARHQTSGHPHPAGRHAGSSTGSSSSSGAARWLGAGSSPDAFPYAELIESPAAGAPATPPAVPRQLRRSGTVAGMVATAASSAEQRPSTPTHALGSHHRRDAGAGRSVTLAGSGVKLAAGGGAGTSSRSRRTSRESLQSRSSSGVGRRRSTSFGHSGERTPARTIKEMLTQPEAPPMPEDPEYAPERYAQCMRLLWLAASMKSFDVVVCLLPTDEAVSL